MVYDASNPLAGAVRCRHCGGVAKTRSDEELRQVCNICGSPSMEVGDDVQLSGAEDQHLKAARASQKSRFLWRLAGVFGTLAGGFGVLATGLVAAIFSVGVAGAGVGLVMAAPFLLLAAVGFSKAGSKTDAIQESLDKAWTSAARDIVLAHPGGITVAALGKMLKLDSQQTEAVGGKLTADSSLSARITAGGELSLSAIAVGPRIDTTAGSSKSGSLLEKRFEELEEQLASEEAAAAAAISQKVQQHIK